VNPENREQRQRHKQPVRTVLEIPAQHEEKNSRQKIGKDLGTHGKNGAGCPYTQSQRENSGQQGPSGEPFMNGPGLSGDRGGKRLGMRDRVVLQDVTASAEVPPHVGGRNGRDAKSKYAEEQDRGDPVAGKSCVLGPNLSRGGARPLRGDILIRSFLDGRVHSIHVHPLAYPSENSGAKRSVVRIAGGGLHKTMGSF